MSDADIRTDPLPPGVELDYDRLPQLIGEAMIAADPDYANEIQRDLVLGEFGWLIDKFDEQGTATVSVIAQRDGRIAGRVRRALVPAVGLVRCQTPSGASLIGT